MSKSKSKKRRGPKGIPAGIKLNAVERMKLGCNVSELADELGVHRGSLYIWKRQFQDPAQREGITEMDPRERRIRELQQQVSRLENKVGRQTLELDFFAKALRRVEPLLTRGSGEKNSTTPSPKRARKAN